MISAQHRTVIFHTDPRQQSLPPTLKPASDCPHCPLTIFQSISEQPNISTPGSSTSTNATSSPLRQLKPNNVHQAPVADVKTHITKKLLPSLHRGPPATPVSTLCIYLQLLFSRSSLGLDFAQSKMNWVEPQQRRQKSRWKTRSISVYVTVAGPCNTLSACRPEINHPRGISCSKYQIPDQLLPQAKIYH